jgi:hypothetical protein
MSSATPIIRDTRQRALIAGVGQTVFSFDAPLFDTLDLSVMKMAATDSAYSMATGYSVALVGSSGATVTFAVAPRPTLGDPAVTLLLTSQRIANRITDVTRGGALSSAMLERELDIIETVLQELRRDVSAETTRAEAAETAETTRAELAEAAIASSVVAETTRAGLAEAGIASSVVNEATRALAAEARIAYVISVIAPSTGPFVLGVTVAQAMAWAAANGVLYTLDNAVPADIANAVTMRWRRGLFLSPGDALYTFVQTTLGYTAGQMTTAFSAMQGYAA